MGTRDISAGPWGGNGGTAWDDGVYTDIRQIIIVHAEAIESVKFEYDRDGSPAWSDRHGGTGDIKTDKIGLDYPKEILISVSGHFCPLSQGSSSVIRSLTFESNFQKYGPYGVQHGTYFSFSKPGSKIVGFHGRSGLYLDCIGTYISNLGTPAATLYLISPVSHGPWGGSGGTDFHDGIYTGVRQIVLSRGAGIASIKVEYDRNGQSIWGNRHGGTTNAFKTDRILFDYPSEILTSITGYYGTVLLMGPTVIRSLTFHTNLRNYGPYGEEQGTFFPSKIVRGKIVGFHGRKGWCLDAIGVHMLEGQNDLDFSKESLTLYSLTSRHGPWGGSGGGIFDDGIYTGIRQIVLYRGAGITAIKVEYDRNGQAIWANTHGGTITSVKTHRILFNYPYEILTTITGYFGTVLVSGPTVIKSLTFHTTSRSYGPYGEEQGTCFSSQPVRGRIVGFHGRKSWLLDAIGVHVG